MKGKLEVENRKNWEKVMKYLCIYCCKIIFEWILKLIKS
jgi:hypothetical protein